MFIAVQSAIVISKLPFRRKLSVEVTARFRKRRFAKRQIFVNEYRWNEIYDACPGWAIRSGVKRASP